MPSNRPLTSTLGSGKTFPHGRGMSSMTRIAVAGTGGLARLIAHYIDGETAHQVLLISRTAQPQLENAGFQVAVVDYNDFQSIVFALRGVHTVISTITGQPQLELIKAALATGVSRYAPAEFEGLPRLRPANGPLDRSRTAARQLLSHHSQSIQSTTFVCGILYERFQPGGLRQSSIGATSGFDGEGEYMMDCRNMRAHVPTFDANNTSNVTICLTSAQDVARFVTKAIDMPDWPPELKMCGLRIAVKDLAVLVQRLKQQRFEPIVWHDMASLRAEMQIAVARQDVARGVRLHALIATAEGRYDFTLTSDTTRSLNHLFPDLRPIPFQEWFVRAWDPEQA